jgi:hypothetical protein
VSALLLAHPLNRQRRATGADIAAHLRDYPVSPLADARADAPGTLGVRA